MRIQIVHGYLVSLGSTSPLFPMAAAGDRNSMCVFVFAVSTGDPRVVGESGLVSVFFFCFPCFASSSVFSLYLSFFHCVLIADSFTFGIGLLPAQLSSSVLLGFRGFLRPSSPSFFFVWVHFSLCLLCESSRFQCRLCLSQRCCALFCLPSLSREYERFGEAFLSSVLLCRVVGLL